MDARAQIFRFLEALTSRDRGLRLARVGLAVAAGAFAWPVLLAVGFSVGGGRGLVGVLGSAVTGAAVLGVGALALRGWAESGKPPHQARRVEALVPGLRGRLSAAVDEAAAAGAKPAPRAVSAVLLARATEAAASGISGLRPSQVLPLGPLRPWAAGLGAAVGAAILATALLPVTPWGALTVLAGGSAASARLAQAGPDAVDARAVIGDITLRYVFPDYTGMEPVEVPNSDGTIHAPPGTRVEIRARSLEPFDAAALQVDAAAPVDATLANGRDVSTSLVVERSGSWAVLLFRGKDIVRSPDYAIEAEADGAPVVTANREGGATQPVDRPLRLRWAAQDDFGLRDVVLEVQRADGTRTRVPLRTPLDPSRNLDGDVGLTPEKLGLKPGESVVLRVVATDNDAAAGGKEGQSADVPLTIAGPQGSGPALGRHYEALRDALVLGLADFLVEKVPPGDEPAAVREWVGRARARLEPAQALMRAQWGASVASSGLDGVLMSDVNDRSGRLFRFAMTTWEPGSGRRVTDTDRATFRDLHAETVAAMERAIFVLDEAIQKEALSKLAEQAQRLESMAKSMADAAPTAEAAELLAMLDQLERNLARFAEAAKKLDDNSLGEFLNSRVQETTALADQIRSLIAEGRLDEARAAMQLLAEQLQQMAEGVNDRFASQMQSEDNLSQAFDDAMKGLEALQRDQESLAREMASAREQDGGAAEQQAALWRKVDTLAENAVAAAKDALAGAGGGAGWRVEGIRAVERMGDQAQGVRDGVRARDAARVLERLGSARRAQVMSERLARVERERPRAGGEPVPEGAPRVESRSAEVGRIYDEMESLLQKLAQRQSQDGPAVRQKAQELADRQRALEGRQQQLSKDVQRVERALPAADGSAGEAMGRAGEAMGRAEDALRQGQGTQGEGHQLDAASQLGQARERLSQQMQQHQQMQQQMRNGGQGEGGGGRPDDGQDGMSQQQAVELPAPELFQTPEAYRRALLEGMSGEVPEEFEALKKRYYEELVRQ